MMIEIYLTSYLGLGLEDLPSCLGLGLEDLPTTLVSDWRTFLSEQTCLMFCPPGLPLSTASYKLENLEKTNMFLIQHYELLITLQSKYPVPQYNLITIVENI